MPLAANNRRVTSLYLMHHFTSLPAPPAGVSTSVSTHNILAIRTEGHIDSIAGIVVSAEALLAVLAEALARGVDDDLVVTALEGGKWLGGMRSCAVHGEHIGLSYEFYGNWDTIFPGSEGFIVRGCNEATVVVAEGNGVDLDGFSDEFGECNKVRQLCGGSKI
jgi:hypothetical protein